MDWARPEVSGRAIVESASYVSIAFLLSGGYLLLVSRRLLSKAGDDGVASIAAGVGWAYVAVGIAAAVMWVVIG